MSPNYVLAVLKRFDTRPAGGDDLIQRCQLAAAICDLSIVVAFGHNELWRPKGRKEGLCYLLNVLAARAQRTVTAEGYKSGYCVGLNITNWQR